MNDTDITTIQSSEGFNKEAATGGPSKKTRLTQSIPTDRLTFPKQCEIIRAYPAAYEKVGGAVSIDDITEFVKMAPATISQSNAFLTDVGVIQKEGRRFIPSQELQAMYRLYGINPSKAWAKLAPLFERAWFGQVVIPKVRYQAMSEEDLIHELADAATAEKDHLPQLRLIVEYLALVGLVQRDGGYVKLINQVGAGSAEEVEKPKAEAAAAAQGDLLASAKEEGLEPYPLVLDPSRKRRIVLYAPPSITKKELARIQQWLSFQLIIADADAGDDTAKAEVEK